MHTFLQHIKYVGIVGASLLLLAAQSPGPVPPRGPEARLQRQAERLKYDLKLTEQQYQDLLALNATHLQKLQALRGAARGSKPDPEALRANAEQLRAEHQAAIDALLSPEQRARKTELEETDFRAQLVMRQARLQHEELLIAREKERLTQVLLLSEDQQTQLEALLRQRNAALGKLIEATLASETANRETFRKEQQAAQQAYRKQLKGLLNPAQLEKLQRMAQHRLQGHGGPHRQGRFQPGPHGNQPGGLQPEGPPDDNE